MKIISMVAEYEVCLSGIARRARYDGQTGVLEVLGLSETDARALLVKAEDAVVHAAIPAPATIGGVTVESGANMHAAIAAMQEITKPAKAKKQPAPKTSTTPAQPSAPSAPSASEPPLPVKLVILGDSVAAVAAPEATPAQPKPVDPGPPVTQNLQPRELTEGERLDLEGKPTPERIAVIRAMLPADLSRVLKIREILGPLMDAGVTDVEEFVAICESLRPEIPSLRIMQQMRERVMQTLPLLR